jgi:hypothetical protein
MMRKLATALLALCLALPALAVEIAGVKLDDKASVGGQELVLNGAGIRTKVFFKVYVASLYLPAKATDLAGVLARGPRRIQMNVLRDLTADQLVDALVEGLNNNNTASELAAIKAQTGQLESIMKAFKNVKEGDVVTLDFVDGGTRIGFGGADRGTIKGEAFNAALMRVWLGDKPAQTDLKTALLGG